MRRFISIIIILSNTCIISAQVPVSRVPFTYVIDYTYNQAIIPEFRINFSTGIPSLYHPGAGLRYLGRFGFGGMVFENRKVPFEEYKQQIREYLKFLKEKGVHWVTPYLCNQTISGNYKQRYGVWEIYDRWEDYDYLQLGSKPRDPIEWMQREPSGNLHYNYKRKCFLERHDDDLQIRYAACPNNQEWRNLMNSEARRAAQLGFDGLFIDNNIIHCYCGSCQSRFQEYLKLKYPPKELVKAFGTENYQEITLYPEGDFRTWARSMPAFIPWLENKYPPEERRIIFDTTGPLSDINVDAAGLGMLFGRCQNFITERVLPADVRPTYENIRLANPALQTAAGRLRWAETLMFWASSIGDQLAEMTAAGREVNKDFFLIPNLGVRQRILGAGGRAEEGKNMRLWAKGATWQMYEEDSGTGTIVPGIVLDYDAQLRYAFACGVRSMLLPYTLNDPDVEEIHHAEAAVSGSSVFVTSFRNEEIRAKYRSFFENHTVLFDGYVSAAKVALAHFYDQVHYINIEHLREVYALNRYLADQQIPFDHIIETDFNPERLANYKVIILANIEFMSDPQIEAIQNFINQGGTVLLIGNNASYDLYAQIRKRNQIFTARPGEPKSLVTFSSLESALPYRGMLLGTALEATRDKLLSSNFEGNKYSFLKDIDKKFGIKRYLKPGPVTDVIQSALQNSAHLLDPVRASGIRNTTWMKREGNKNSLTIHLVNKNVSLSAAPGKRILQTVKDLEVTIPELASKKIKSVNLHQPGQKRQQLEVLTDKNGKGKVVLAQLNAYGIIEVSF